MRKGRGEVAVAAVAVEVRASTREQAKAMSVVDIVVIILFEDLFLSAPDEGGQCGEAEVRVYGRAGCVRRIEVNERRST